MYVEFELKNGETFYLNGRKIWVYGKAGFLTIIDGNTTVADWTGEQLDRNVFDAVLVDGTIIELYGGCAYPSFNVRIRKAA